MTTYGILTDTTGESWVATWDDSGTITAFSELPMSQHEHDAALADPPLLEQWYLIDDEDTLEQAREWDEAGHYRRTL